MAEKDIKSKTSKSTPDTSSKKVTEKQNKETAVKSSAKAKSPSAVKPETTKTADKPETAAKKTANSGSVTAAAKAVNQKQVRAEAKSSLADSKQARKSEKKKLSAADMVTSFKGFCITLYRRRNEVTAWTLVVVMLAGMLASLVLGLVVFGKDNPVTVIDPPKDVYAEAYSYGFNSVSQVGFYGEVVGKTTRNKPVSEVKDGGLASGYPTWGTTLAGVIGSEPEQVAARNALIAESNKLAATGTANAGGGGGYTWMDANGFLYAETVANPEPCLDAEGNHRQLYQHTGSVGLYGGNVDDAQDRIIKDVTMRVRGYNGYGVTGVYAPAGEVIKIEISEEDMNATGGITVHIGQALYNGQANNIWTAKNQMQRMPVILNTMSVNKNTATLKDGVYTAYVGSFLGGPLYIRNTTAQFTARISGGVAYSHFILGYTTQEEFEENAKSTAPYFDLEVWDYGVLHSGPKRYAQSFGYDDLYKAAVLWEKVSLVSTTGASQGIVFIYDAFVAAGAAVAFPGRRSVNCPAGWMSGALNYNGIVTSGSWGNFHEYHHNFQGYGVGNGGEVTNNGMTLVSYALFTKISAARNDANYGAGGMSGWNCYTSATWALNEILKISKGQSPSNGNQGLTLYATLLHNFGPDNYIQSKYRQQSKRYGENYTGYMRAWQDVTHNNMSYYFKDVLQGVSVDVANQYSNPDYPMFVPVSCIYQTGRSYMYDGQKKYFKTMQPYVIPYGDDFTVDLSRYQLAENGSHTGSIVMPDGFDYTVKKISQPSNGSIKMLGSDKFVYTPGKEMQSGQIVVTLGITKKDNAFKVDDVDLVLEFEQTHEKNKLVLERNTYVYEEGERYSDAEEAFNADYKGYKEKIAADSLNPTQNSNTDIWYYPAGDTDPAHEAYKAPKNAIAEVSGKLYFSEKGTYRIYLRGRLNCAVFYSIDGGQTYQRGAAIKLDSAPNQSWLFRPADAESYFDLKDVEAESWVYFKTVLIVETEKTTAFVGLGMAKWTEPMFTIREKYYDADGNEIADKDGAARTETHYYDLNGREVSEAEANASNLIEPSASSQPAHLNAYRSTYEFPVNKDFETPYFYTRSYSYDYRDNVWQNKEQTLVSSNYDASKSWNFGLYKTENLTDGNRNTIIHTKNGWGASESKALQFVLDVGEAKHVNRIAFYTQYRPNGDYHAPTAFTLEGSADGEQYFTIGKFSECKRSGLCVSEDFDDAFARYFRITVTGSESNSLLILSEVELWRVNEILGAKLYSGDDAMFTFSKNWTNRQTLSTFGGVYSGEKGDMMKFEFTGSRFAILSSNALGKDFEVYVDGVKVDSIEVKEPSGATSVSYMSPLLSNGRHKVEIKCVGQANVDSVAIYPDAEHAE